MKTNREFQEELERLVSEYEKEVIGTKLKPKAMETYIRYVDMFVRWCKDDFVPGGRL